MRARASRSGFTLLELLAVVALLGLVLFFVVPNLDSITPRARLKSAARRIGTTMELAQGEAIASGKEFTLAYDLSKGTYWIILPPADPTTAGTAPPPTNNPNEPPPPPPDVEHDDKPPVTAPAGKPGSTPSPSPATTSAPNYQNREIVGDDTVGDDMQIASVSLPNGKETTS